MNEKDIPLRFPRSRKIAICLICVCAILFFLRRPILTAIAASLVRPEEAPSAADILALGGDGASQVTQAWLSDHEDAKLLLLEKPPPRVVQIGATISEAERRKAISLSAGIPANRIEILIGTSMQRIRPVRAMERWLSANPARKIHVLCDQFQSRGLRRAIDRGLDGSTSSRITLQPLVDRRFTTSDWWTTRLGIRAVFDAYLSLARSVLGRGSPEPPRYLTPDQYEQAFLDSLQREK